jgi:hypothetical protein
MEKYFICTDEPNPNDPKKKFYHRIGELLRFETKAGGHFYKVKDYRNPEKLLTVFKDEPKGGSPAPQNDAPSPSDNDQDLPF